MKYSGKHVITLQTCGAYGWSNEFSSWLFDPPPTMTELASRCLTQVNSCKVKWKAADCVPSLQGWLNLGYGHFVCFFCSRFTLWRSSTAMQNGHVWQIIYTWVICHGYSMLNYQRPTMGTTCDVGPAQFFNWLVNPVAGQSITAHPQKRLWDVTWDLGFWWIWIILDYPLVI